MQRRLKRQHGAALIVVLSLLTVSLMVGLSSMLSARIDERLAGNYRAYSEAQMGAEKAVSIAWGEVLSDPTMLDAADKVSSDEVRVSSYSDFVSSSSAGDVCLGSLNCYYRVISSGDDGYLVGLGSVNDVSGEIIALSEYVFAKVELGGSGDDFGDSVTGCEGISLGGGPQIDSYNSNYGAYGELVTVDGMTIANKLRSEAIVRSVSDSADLALSGNSPIYGDVYVTGDFSLNGGTPVYGNVYADGSVNMNGSIYGDLTAIGNIDFGTASKIEGNTVSKGDVVVGATGNPPTNISANGSISYPSWWQWDSSKMALAENYRERQDNDISRVYDPDQICDEIGVVSEDGEPGKVFDDIWEDSGLQGMSDWLEANLCAHCYSENGGRFSFTGGAGNSDASTTVIGSYGETTALRIDSDVTTGGRLDELKIRGNVKLIVDGDFDLGNNTALSIDENSTLSIYVTGKTKLGSGSDLLSGGGFVRETVDGEKKPAVMLYSAYNHFGGNPNSAGVTVNGSNDSYISIYAPNTDTVITGSGSLYGSIRSGYIDMRGSGDIHYDEALKDVDIGQDGSGSAVPSITSWQ